MPLRVIAGSARGRKLKLVPGDTTRPVMDRVKEACFNIIGQRIVDATFLDLFAGTGSVGIEALSRGARRAIFVESQRIAVQTITENLTIARLADRADVRRLDVFAFLKRPVTQSCDFIYIAPPQYESLWLKTLQQLDMNPGWLSETGWLIVQIDPNEKVPINLKHFAVSDERRYGKTMLWFFTRRSEA